MKNFLSYTPYIISTMNDMMNETFTGNKTVENENVPQYFYDIIYWVKVLNKVTNFPFGIVGSILTIIVVNRPSIRPLAISPYLFGFAIIDGVQMILGMIFWTTLELGLHTLLFCRLVYLLCSTIFGSFSCFL